LLSCTISINQGAVFTGQRAVQVVANVPGATEMQLSNDGGFGETTWQPYQPSVAWELRDPRYRIATLVVYARFRDADGYRLCGGANLSDDIIIDPLPPTVAVAIADVGRTAAAGDAASQPSRSIRLRITATDQDNGSGVEQMQISTEPTFSGASWQPYSATTETSANPGETIYVRVNDGVGNVSEPAQVVVPAPGDLQPQLYLPLVQH
jgi:hypothetical protein